MTSFALHEVARGSVHPTVEWGVQSRFVSVAVVSEDDDLVFSGCFDRRAKCGLLLEVCVALWMKSGSFMLEEESPNFLAEGAKVDVDGQLPVGPLSNCEVFRLVECDEEGCCSFPRVDGGLEVVVPDVWRREDGADRWSGAPRRVTIPRPFMDPLRRVSVEDASVVNDSSLGGGNVGEVGNG